MSERSERGPSGPMTEIDPVIEIDPVLAVSAATETLLRLSASRRVHDLQATAAGVTISKPGLVLLRRLAQHGPCTLGDLARDTHIDPSAVGRQVAALEQTGYVQRNRDHADGRVTIARATPEGEAALRRVIAVGDGHLTDALAGWPDAERREFARLLARFVEDLRRVGIRPRELAPDTP
jgi:DNA-binding MarR family transcriptional regulator